MVDFKRDFVYHESSEEETRDGDGVGVGPTLQRRETTRLGPETVHTWTDRGVSLTYRNFHPVTEWEPLVYVWLVEISLTQERSFSVCREPVWVER